MGKTSTGSSEVNKSYTQKPDPVQDQEIATKAYADNSGGGGGLQRTMIVSKEQTVSITGQGGILQDGLMMERELWAASADPVHPPQTNFHIRAIGIVRTPVSGSMDQNVVLSLQGSASDTVTLSPGATRITDYVDIVINDLARWQLSYGPEANPYEAHIQPWFIFQTPFQSVDEKIDNVLGTRGGSATMDQAVIDAEISRRDYQGEEEEYRRS